MPGKTILRPDELLRLFYKHPLEAFPVLDSAFSFSGLIQKRYIESASSSFSSAKTTIKGLIDRYVSQPVPGDIVRRIFGKAKIQPIPVLSREGVLLGVWELSFFFRVFDSTPMSAYLDFRSIFDALPVPLLIANDKEEVLSYNREFSLLSGILQNDRSVHKRRLLRVFKELGWTVRKERGAGQKLCLSDAVYPLLTRKVPVPGGPPLKIFLVLQHASEHLNTQSLSLLPALEACERRFISAALKSCRGDISTAAERLGIPRQTLQYKLGKLNIAAELYLK